MDLPFVKTEIGNLCQFEFIDMLYVCRRKTIGGHPHMTSDFFKVFLTYLPTHVRFCPIVLVLIYLVVSDFHKPTYLPKIGRHMWTAPCIFWANSNWTPLIFSPDIKYNLCCAPLIFDTFLCPCTLKRVPSRDKVYFSFESLWISYGILCPFSQPYVLFSKMSN